MQLGPYPHQHNGAGILQIQQNQVCPRRETCICRRGHTGIYVPGLVRDWQTYSVAGETSSVSLCSTASRAREAVRCVKRRSRRTEPWPCRLKSRDVATQKGGFFARRGAGSLLPRRLRSSYSDRGTILLRSSSAHRRDRSALHPAAS